MWTDARSPQAVGVPHLRCRATSRQHTRPGRPDRPPGVVRRNHQAAGVRGDGRAGAWPIRGPAARSAIRRCGGPSSRGGQTSYAPARMRVSRKARTCPSRSRCCRSFRRARGRPPLPPPSMVIAGMPRYIAALASVEPSPQRRAHRRGAVALRAAADDQCGFGGGSGRAVADDRQRRADLARLVPARVLRRDGVIDAGPEAGVERASAALSASADRSRTRPRTGWR